MSYQAKLVAALVEAIDIASDKELDLILASHSEVIHEWPSVAKARVKAMNSIELHTFAAMLVQRQTALMQRRNEMITKARERRCLGN